LSLPPAPLDEALEEGAGPLAVASRLLPFLHYWSVAPVSLLTITRSVPCGLTS
jgi:hypothetical protein